MAIYTLHLGFYWNSPLIGWTWGSPSPTYRFLQYALADSSASPGWFDFEVNDGLSVMVWDLSSSPQTMALALDMSLGYLEPGPTKTYEPSTYLNLGTVATQQGQADPYYFSFNTVSGGPQTSSSSSPWGDCTSWYQATGAGPLTFTSKFNCKLSFRLTAAPTGGDDDPQIFISDPEVIVGSRG